MAFSTNHINGSLDRQFEGDQFYCIYELFEAQVERDPNLIAVEDAGEKLTYQELNTRANQLAHYLQSLGVKPEVLVGICVERSLEMIVGLLGILKAGGAYVPLDPAYPQERLAFMLADAQVSVLLTQERLLGDLPNNTAKVVCLDSDWKNIAQYRPENPLSQTTEDNLAYVMYTSGSTGTPKGVMIQHKSLVNYTKAVSVEYQLNARDKILQFASISFDISVEEIYPCLSVGATLVLRTDAMLATAKNFLEKCQEWQITVLDLPTAYWHELAAALDTEKLTLPSSIRLVIIGGEKALLTRLKTWHNYVGEQVRLVNTYGPTETTVSALMCDLPKSLLEQKLTELPIGKPVTNTQAYILDSELQLVPIGTAGELYIGGISLARGYLNRPDLTAEKFIPNPYWGDGENTQPNFNHLYRTGDIVRCLPDGNLEFVGRVDQQVKIRGFRIELGEIETLLNQHPAVQAAVVVDREDIPGQKNLAAYIVPNYNHEIIQDQVTDWNTEHISQAENLYNEIYQETVSQDQTLNFIGWNSSYTDRLLPEAEMREWVNNTVDRILSNQPQRVLELGCGTGMLLFRIAPHTQEYLATDFSTKVIQDLQQQLNNLEQKLPQVILNQRTADNFEGIEANTFDTVILNSVSQHFPNIEYMLQVMEGAVKAVKPGGRVFIGDVRSFTLLEAFHTSIQLYKASDSLSREQLRSRIKQRVTQEGELVIAPEFFTALKQHLPKIGEVSIQLKHGQYHNELTRFRYDVTLHIQGENQPDIFPNEITWLDWEKQQLTLSQLCKLLQENEPDILGLKNIPNARLSTEIKTLEWLSTERKPATVGEWRQLLSEQKNIGIDPEDIWNLSNSLPYIIDIRASKNCYYDVVLLHCHNAVIKRLPVLFDDVVKPWSYYANQPQKAKIVKNLIPQIRAFIKEKLPDYMMPSSFTMLETLPFTPNGKVDRRALPAPEQNRPELAENFVAARTPIEELLVSIWADVLHLEKVGIYDNFFELGGHSLLGAQIISLIRKHFKTELPLKKLFECATVAGLAEALTTKNQEESQQLPPILPVSREQHLPLAFMQQQMWLFAQQQPNLPCYNNSILLRLPGVVNTTALVKALNAIIQRHEAWRTNFDMVDGLPIQIIHPTNNLNLVCVDLAKLPPEEQEKEALRLAKSQTIQNFDLSQDLLLRATLFRFNQSQNWLVLTLHHIIYDGVSLHNVFLKELQIFYKAFCDDKHTLLPELTIQYADYAVWERKWLQKELSNDKLKYWQQKLANLSLLPLPSVKRSYPEGNRPRLTDNTYLGASQPLKLSKDLTEKLKKLAVREGVTLFMTLLSAFKALLYRYTSQEDIPISIVSSNANQSELSNLLGLFINLLVLRTDIKGNQSFRKLLKQVWNGTLEAYNYKDVPFDQLIETLPLEHRRLGQNPLFQVLFLLDPPVPSLDLGWEIDHKDFFNGTALSDLILELFDSPDGLFGFLQYSTDLFDAPTIERMVGHYCTLLESIVANPDQHISELPILTRTEQEQLQQWNNTEFDYSEDVCLHQLFEIQVAKTPDAVAVTFEGEQLTYQELNQRANQLAHHLRSLGVKPDVMVGICVERSLEMAVGILGILKAGGAYVPLDPNYPQERLAFMLADTQVSVLLTQQRLVSELPEHQANVVCLDSDWQDIAQLSSENIANSVTPDHLAYVIYTSGSTGRPKGICLEQRPLLNLLHWHYSSLLTGARTLQFASLSFDASFHEMFAAWGTGGKLFIIPENLRLDVIGLGRYISEQEIEKVILPVVLLQQLAESLGERGIAALQPEMFSNLKEVTTTGEQLQITPAIAHLFKSLPHCAFHNHYGPSETHVVTALSLSNHPSKWEYHPPIGVPIANTQIYLVDQHFNLVPVGVPGELCIGGVSLARGYLNRPDLTAEKFIPNPFNAVTSALNPLLANGEATGGGVVSPPTRLYRTGDLARYLPDGNIEYLGRIDHQVKIRGFRIELDEIEALLVQHPDVQEAVAIAREDVPGDKRLVAYVVSSLIPNRVPLETECLIEFNQNTFKLTTEDISVGGLCLVGIPNDFQPGANVQLYLQLPGTSHKQWLKGKIAWCQGQKAGINLDLNSTEQALLEESVDYLLEMQGLLKALHRTITQNLRQFLQEQLPSYMIPDRFVILNSLPLTPNGKIDRRALPVPTQSQQQFVTGFVAPRTPVEEVVAGIWMKLLGQQVSIHDNFLEVGGNSILAMQVISRLRDVFKMELPLRSLFESPTVAGMAQRIELMSQSSFKLDDAPVVHHEINIQLTPLQKVTRPHLIPTSFAQQRLWFLEQLNPGSPKYNLPLILEFTGLLDVTVFEQSCQEIIRRHEALRTNFTQVDGQPVQVISANIPLHINVFDLEELPLNSRPLEAQNIVDLAVQQPFDLEQDPLLRVTLIHLTATEHILVFVMHHIVSDGWSLGVFTRELMALYESFAQQKPCTLPELPIQYADFGIWQLQQLQGEVLEQNIAYWKKQLGGSLPVLQLPTDRPRPAVQTFAGACQTLIIDKSQTTAIKQLSRQENATLFMTLLTGFKILLYRYTGNEDILVGSPISGRHWSEIESLIGFFVNTQVLRTNLSGSPSFRELLKRVREVTLEAYAHKDLPFEKLVETVQPERNLSQSPLVQVMFALQNVPLLELNSSWKLSELAVNTGTAKFDLSLQLLEINDEIVGELEYNTDLFDATTIQRLIGHFQTLLTAIVANPEQKIAELPLLTAAEFQQLQAWNSTELDYPTNACIHQLFETQVEKTPDAVAVIFEDKQLTYSELNAKANQLAHYLRSAKLSRSESLGVKPEVLVGICVERSLEMVIGILGILKAGGAYLPLDPAYPKERLAFMLLDAQVSVLLTQSDLVKSLPQHQAFVLNLDSDWDLIDQNSQHNLVNSVASQNLAYAIYTSGSTGKPKGVLLTHSGLCNLVTAQIQLFNLQLNSRVLQFASFSFDASVWEIFMALIVGARLVLASRESLLPGDGLIKLLRDEEITTVTLPPSVLAVLPPEELETLQTIIVAGEACASELVAKWAFGRRFFNAYGPTESTVCATIAPLSESNQKLHIGRPIANTQIYILDKQLQLVPAGVFGEIYIGGASLARGYLNRPDLTAEKFIPNPFNVLSSHPLPVNAEGARGGLLSLPTSDRLYKTGDLARYLPDGNIEYLGRIDHQVKVRGFRIELGEIEAALLKHPDVREAFVIASADQRGDQRLVSYIVSNLIPDRLPYQTVVSVELDNTIIQLTTEDISLGGLCLVGVPKIWQRGQIIRLRLLLPGNTEECWLTGNIAWQQGQKAGIQFTINATEQAQVDRSLDYLLQAQGFLKVLQRTVTQNLRQFLQRQLPNYMIPASFVLMRALPLTPNGKLDRKALPDPEIQSVLEAVDLVPKSEIEQTIAKIWQQVLQIERVGINDNFFDLGGHSLLIVQVQSKLQEVLNNKISIVDLFKYPTISTLAQYLNKQPSDEAPIPQISDRASADLSVRAQKQKQALNKQKQRKR
ncbi:MAG TPA: amino acid adenylation domain-containing protein [Oculatellaceae cyanobacterium]|jgi:amino acid adenylation domain-containing protein